MARASAVSRSAPPALLGITAACRSSRSAFMPLRGIFIREIGRRPMVLICDRLAPFDPQALLCTDQAPDPSQILRWFVQRWQLEVTFREMRDHFEAETQRQWSDLAIFRTTPCLLGLFSLVTPLGRQLTPQGAPSRCNQRFACEAAQNLFRHARRRASQTLAGTGFQHVHTIRGHAETPPSATERHYLRPVPRRMMAEGRLSKLIAMYLTIAMFTGPRPVRIDLTPSFIQRRPETGVCSKIATVMLAPM